MPSCCAALKVLHCDLAILRLASPCSDGQLASAISFILDYPHCMWEMLALSISAGIAQLFISFTIKKHGALAFATIMTTRQFLSILVSCAVFLNPLTVGQWCGTRSIHLPWSCKQLGLPWCNSVAVSLPARLAWAPGGAKWKGGSMLEECERIRRPPKGLHWAFTLRWTFASFLQ